MRHLVIGEGQVGTAIAELLRDAWDVETRDIDGPPVTQVDVMHICIPWTDGFEDAVWAYTTLAEPRLIINHASVPVGTSRRIHAVHSPVTGRHPHLLESLRAFTKVFGGEYGDEAHQAAEIFKACGVKTMTVPSPEESEAGKIWSTLQYGMAIAVQKMAYAYARQHNLDPEIIYDTFNHLYNEGYEAVGEPYRLAILKDMPGPIGGHCVIPNARFTDSPLAELLLGWNDVWEGDAIPRGAPVTVGSSRP